MNPLNSAKNIVKNILPYGISHQIIKKNEIERQLSSIPCSEEPAIFNTNGELLKSIFLRDDQSWYNPYCFVDGQIPSYIHWDRYNYGLKNHVYSHKNILNTIGKPLKKFAFYIESESIVPEDYKIFDLNKELDKEFELIFTWSEDILDKYSNAVFIPAYGVWYGTKKYGGVLNPDQYKYKTKNISIISSAKLKCELHNFRINTAKHFKYMERNSPVDTYGKFDGGEGFEKISDPLEQYRYNIAIENNISPYYFTEKILNCFASFTVPIYIGATKINDFFNPNGIIQVKSTQENVIDKIVSSCDETDYLRRIPALIDNFSKVKEYLCIEDYLYTHYKKHFI
jgi:hypothetical protein